MKRYSPVFYRLALANFLFFLGNSLYILFPVFLKGLGASESYIGFMNNIDKIFVILTAVFVGWFMRGRDLVVYYRVGYVILLAAFPAYLLIDHLSWVILAVRVLHGIGFAVAMILGTTIIFESVDAREAAEAIGFYGITGALSNAISPLAGEALLGMGYPHSLLFAISTVFVAASLCVAMTLERRPSGAPAADNGDTGDIPGLLSDPRFLLISALTFIFGGLFGILITYLPNFVRLTTGFRFSWFFTMYIITLVAVRFSLLGSLGRMNANALLAAMCATGCACNLLLNALHSVWVLVFVGVLYGITHGVLYPVLNTITVMIVHEDHRGRSNALFTAFFNSGMLAFAAGLGRLVDYTGTYLAAFNAAAAAAVLGMLVVGFMTLRFGRIEIAGNGTDPGEGGVS